MKRKLFVPNAFLTWYAPDKLGEYLRTLRMRWRNGETTEWEEMESGDVKGVNYLSIKDATLRRYNLPSAAVVHFEVERWKRETEAEQQGGEDAAYYEAIDELYHCLYQEKKHNANTHFNFIKSEYSLPVEKCREFAEKWAAWKYILENYSRSANSLQIVLEAYNRAFPNSFESKHSLSNFKRKCEANGIEATVIDQRSIKKAQKRISEFQYNFLKCLYIQSAKNTARGSHKKLEAACAENGEKAYGLGSVKIYFREFEKNIEMYGMRYGQAAAQKKQPYASLLPAEHINTQWQMDGWTLPFWSDKFQRYTLQFVIDNHSRKIVGYSVGRSENTVLVLETLDEAMRKTGYLPAELVSDSHSFHKTDIASRFKSETGNMGMVWTKTTNAQRNQLVERYNQYFDELCKDFKGYLGKNVTAKGKNARLSAEEYEELRKSKNWLTEEEIKAIAVYVIREYNKTGLSVHNGLSPNEKYSQSEAMKAFMVDENLRVKLIRPIRRYIVQRGQITIKVGTVKHEFQLPATLIDQYNSEEVEVVYEDLQQGIYLFDPKSGDALGSVAPKKKIRGAIADQTEEDRRLLNQQTGRVKGTTTKARKREIDTLAAALKNNPDATAYMSSHSMPKDVRQMALQDKELQRDLRDMGVNEHLLPIRDINTSVPVIPITKTKESPFTSNKHQIKIMTADEIYGANIQP